MEGEVLLVHFVPTVKSFKENYTNQLNAKEIN